MTEYQVFEEVPDDVLDWDSLEIEDKESYAEYQCELVEEEMFLDVWQGLDDRQDLRDRINMLEQAYSYVAKICYSNISNQDAEDLITTCHSVGYSLDEDDWYE